MAEEQAHPSEAQRREAEAVRRSEQRFRALVEHSADAIVLVGPDAAFRYVSGSTLRVLGRPPSDLEGRDVFELMHPEDVPRCRELFRQCLENPGVLVRADFRYRHQDGSWRHMQAEGVNRLDDPDVGGVVANFRDVTERRLAADAQRRSEERQALLYGVLAAAGAELDVDRVLAAAVRVMAERSGWRNIHVSVPSEDGRHWKVRACSDEGLIGSRLPIGPGIVGRAWRTGRTQHVPDVLLDPEYVAVGPDIRSEIAAPIRHAGRSLGVLNVESEAVGGLTAEDARLVESVAEAVAPALENAGLYRAAAAERERLRSLIAASDNGILLLGADGAIHVLNPPAARLLGLSAPAEAWLGKPAAGLLASLDAREARGLIAREASGGPDPERREGEFDAPGRSVRWSSRPVRTSEAFLGRLLILRDVTEERRLQRLQADLTDALVHDLRGPLTSILGALSLIEPELGPSTREWAGRASKAAARMISMVESILEISRLEQGAVPVERGPLDLARALAEAADARRPAAEAKGLRLEVLAAADAPPALADAALVGRVLDNLLANAVRSTPAGGSVRASLEANGAELQVTVSDTGPGVPASLQQRLFEKFASGDRSGIGLGLAFCRLAIEAHGGRIWAENGPEAGAAFTFTLPKAPAVDSPPGA